MEPPRLGEDMKRDPYFKYVAAVLFVGVIIAIADPTPLPGASRAHHAKHGPLAKR